MVTRNEVHQTFYLTGIEADRLRNALKSVKPHEDEVVIIKMDHLISQDADEDSLDILSVEHEGISVVITTSTN